MADPDDEPFQEPRVVAMAWAKLAIGDGRLDLASENPRSESADDFFVDRGAYLQRTYAYADMEYFTAGQNHRLLAPDMEIVLLIDGRGLGVDAQWEPAWLPETHARTLPIAMRLLGNRWLVHGPGVVMEPGWPPTVIETLSAE